MGEPKVVVITINYNQDDYTIKCVKSILQSAYDNYALLLIDNGSLLMNYKQLCNKLPDDEHLILRRLENNRGYVGGVNYGLREGMKLSPDYFLIMNNDTIIDKHAIRSLVDTCKEYKNIAIVTGKVLSFHHPDIIQTTGTLLTNKNRIKGYYVGENEKDGGQYDHIEERDIVDDIFWLFHKQLIKTIGYYSDWFGFGYEQADFALRAKKHGYKLIYTYKAKLWHFGNATVGKTNSPYKAFWSLQGYLIFRYLYQSKLFFFETYLISWLVIFKALVNDFLSLFPHAFKKKYGMALFLSMLRFHFWLMFRISYTKFVPGFVK